MGWLGRTVEGASKAAVIPVLTGGTAAAAAASRGARPSEVVITGLLGVAGGAVVEALGAYEVETRGRRTKAPKTPQG